MKDTIFSFRFPDGKNVPLVYKTPFRQLASFVPLVFDRNRPKIHRGIERIWLGKTPHWNDQEILYIQIYVILYDS